MRSRKAAASPGRKSRHVHEVKKRTASQNKGFIFQGKIDIMCSQRRLVDSSSSSTKAAVVRWLYRKMRV